LGGLGTGSNGHAAVTIHWGVADLEEEKDGVGVHVADDDPHPLALRGEVQRLQDPVPEGWVPDMVGAMGGMVMCLKARQ